MGACQLSAPSKYMSFRGVSAHIPSKYDRACKYAWSQYVAYTTIAAAPLRWHGERLAPQPGRSQPQSRQIEWSFSHNAPTGNGMDSCAVSQDPKMSPPPLRGAESFEAEACSSLQKAGLMSGVRW